MLRESLVACSSGLVCRQPGVVVSVCGEALRVGWVGLSLVGWLLVDQWHHCGCCEQDMNWDLIGDVTGDVRRDVTGDVSRGVGWDVRV